MSQISTPWESIPFVSCLDELGISKPGKLFARDYEPTGKIPVIDQGQDFIAGWTNRDELAIRERLPFIVFGDHTRAFKFVDFPFALGADGTQLLKPKKDFNPRFFYYACLNLPLPNRGYNRHFTVLKEQSLPLPLKTEQDKIATLLWKVQCGIEAQEKLIATTRELKSSTMYLLFTRGLRGEPVNETEIGTVPASWKPMLVGEFGEVVTGTTPKTAERGNYDGGTFHFIAPGDLGLTTQIYTAAKRITEAGLEASRVLPKHSICFVCIGSSIGKVGITTQERSTTNQQINAIIVEDRFDPFFVCYLLAYRSQYVSSFASPSPVPIMSKGKFEQVLLYSSLDFEEQWEIGQILRAIDAKIELHERKRANSIELFKTLLNKLMSGKIRVGELDIDITEIQL